ncbi:MAG: hypothetical protein AAFV53_19925 [Myxococcota bacterium]
MSVRRVKRDDSGLGIRRLLTYTPLRDAYRRLDPELPQAWRPMALQRLYLRGFELLLSVRAYLESSQGES